MNLTKRMLCLGIACLSAMSAQTWAGAFYIGPMVEYDSLTKNHARFLAIAPHFTLGYSDIVTGYFTLGGEIFAGPRSFQISNDTSGGTNLHATYNYGASLLPGYLLDNFVTAYARFGVIRTNFDKLDTVKSGAMVGVGLEAILNFNWSIRGEYDYTHYSSINGVGHVRGDVFGVGLKYTFA